MYTGKKNEELVEMFKAGDEMAFEVLMESTEKIRYKVAQDYLNIPGSELEDLLQDGVMLLVKAAYQYNPDKGAAFSTFLYSRLQKLYKDQFRAETADKRNAHGMVLSYDQLNENSEYDEEGDTLGNEIFSVEVEEYSIIEIRETIKRVSLSKNEDKVIRMLMDGKTKKEIADFMKVKSPSVHTYVHRAGEKLKIAGAFA